MTSTWGKQETQNLKCKNRLLHGPNKKNKTKTPRNNFYIGQTETKTAQF